MEMDVETTQVAAVCLGIGTVILCRRQKKRRQRKIWLKSAEHVLKRQSACAQMQRLIKYSSSEGDQVFLLPLELSPFFEDFFEVVLQATSAMFVTNYPRGYTKVGFCYSQTEKIASKSPQNSSMFKIAAILWRQIATKSS